MSSKRKPNSHLKSQKKKKKIHNSQKITMENIFDRFPNLSDNILKHLSRKSIANCVEVNKKWQTTIENQRVYLIAKIQKWSTNSMRFRKEWSMAFVKIPLELLRRLSEYIMEHKCFVCNSKSIEKHNCKCLVFSPTGVAALHGDIDLFKHVAVKTNRNPKTYILMNSFHLAAFEGQLEICKWWMDSTSFCSK